MSIADFGSEKEKYEALYRRYLTLYDGTELRARGGIFNKPVRAQMLKQKPLTKTKYDFWYLRRLGIRNALIDLQLFVETGGDEVFKVLTKETLKPIFDKLILGSRVIGEKSTDDLYKAEIAVYLIRQSFSFLASAQPEHMTGSHERTMEDAIDLASYLVEQFKPVSGYLRPSAIRDLEEGGFTIGPVRKNESDVDVSDSNEVKK